MANHFYATLNVISNGDKGIDPKITEFIKKNKLPFKVNGYEIEDGEVYIYSVNAYAETRRGNALHGMKFKSEDFNALLPYLKDAHYELRLIDECNGGEIHYQNVKDGVEIGEPVIFNYSQPAEMHAETIYTPKDYLDTHMWDTKTEEERDQEEIRHLVGRLEYLLNREEHNANAIRRQKELASLPENDEIQNAMELLIKQGDRGLDRVVDYLSSKKQNELPF